MYFFWHAVCKIKSVMLTSSFDFNLKTPYYEKQYFIICNIYTN